MVRQKEIGEAYGRVLGRHFPAMTLIVVAGLLGQGAKVEIEGRPLFRLTKVLDRDRALEVRILPGF